MTESERLKIAIVGGGLAGALSARVLREKHDVTIYERSKGASEVGAAINVGPNGVKILESLGFDRSKVGSLAVGRTKTWNKEGKIMLDTPLQCQQEYGADWLFNHRVDLRDEFLRLATAEDSSLPGSPSKIQFGAEVVDVDVETGKLWLADGGKIQADLIIASDGIKSRIRPLVVGDQGLNTARPSGLSAFRFTMGLKKVREIFGSTPDILDESQTACLNMIFSYDGTKRSVVMYPCRNFELLNFVCIVPDESLRSPTTESWTAGGDRDELLSLFNDFPSWVSQYFEHAENIKLWQLRDQDPLPTYVRGRTVLIGDSAHAMTPHQGQGGTQAVEDAEAFRLFLADNVTSADVPSILKDFDSVRRPRASQIQDNTRKATEQRTPEEVFSFAKYNWTYPGVIEGLKRVRAGEKLIQF